MTQNIKVQNILLSFFDGEPANEKDIKELRKNGFPEEYLECFTYSNGGSNFVGEEYLVLWQAENVLQHNTDLESNIYLSKYVFFGDNGGGEGLAFNKSDGSVNIIPIVGMSDDDALFIADSFPSFILHLNDGGEYFTS